MEYLIVLSFEFNILFLYFILKRLRIEWNQRVTRKELYRRVDELSGILDDCYEESRKKSEQIRRLKIQLKKSKIKLAESQGNKKA